MKRLPRLNALPFPGLPKKKSLPLREAFFQPGAPSEAHLWCGATRTRNQPITGERFNSRQQSIRTILFVSVMFFAHLSCLHRNRFDLVANQEAGTFIVADHWIIRIIGQSVERQNQLHPSQKPTIQFPNTPGSLEMGFQFVFLRMFATSV